MDQRPMFTRFPEPTVISRRSVRRVLQWSEVKVASMGTEWEPGSKEAVEEMLASVRRMLSGNQPDEHLDTAIHLMKAAVMVWDRNVYHCDVGMEH